MTLPTPETYCICFEPVSRSRTCGVTNDAATNANGTRMRIEAKAERAMEISACSVFVRGSGCEAVVRVREPPLVSRSCAS